MFTVSDRCVDLPALLATVVNQGESTPQTNDT